MMCSLLFVAVMEILAMNADGVLSQFWKQFRLAPAVRKLPMETAYSYPVPVAPGQVCVYAYRLRGFPPKPPKVGAPTLRFLAEYPSGGVVAAEQVDPMKLPVPPPDGDTYGDVVLPPPYAGMGYPEFAQKQAEFDRLYAAVLEAYFAARPLAQATARQVLEQLPAFAKPPLIPLLRATSPEFFQYLESASGTAAK
jgi:hypothetical protein